MAVFSVVRNTATAANNYQPKPTTIKYPPIFMSTTVVKFKGYAKHRRELPTGTIFRRKKIKGDIFN